MSNRSKRRHHQDDADAPAKVHRATGGAGDSAAQDSRKSHLKAHLLDLNAQFAGWVSSQQAKRPDELWTEGVRDYLRFTEGLLEEFRDVVPVADAPPAATTSGVAQPSSAFGGGSTSNGFGGFGGFGSGGDGGGGGAFGGKATASAAAVSAAPAPSGGFSFAPVGAADKAAAAGSGNGAAAEADKPPMFSFLTSPASPQGAAEAATTTAAAGTTAAASDSAAAKQDAAAAAAAPGQFKFGGPSGRAEGGDAGVAKAGVFARLGSSGRLAGEEPSNKGGAAAGAGSDAAPAKTPAPVFSFLSAPSSESAKTVAGGEDAGGSSATAPAPTFTFGTKPAGAFGSGAGTTAGLFGAPAGGGLFGSSSSAAAGSDSMAKQAAFAFGKPAAAAAGTDGAAAAPAAKPPLFLFGSAATQAAADGVEKSTAVPAGGSLFPGFGGASGTTGGPFGSAPAAAPSAAAAGGGEEAEGEEEGPAKFESAVGVSEEAGTVLFKTKAKFNHLVKDASNPKDPGTWEGKGIGTFMLRTRKDEAAKPFVTFTTEAGRVLYIANMAKNTKLIPNDAKSSVMFSAPWSPDGAAAPTPQGVMFTFGKGKHTEFITELEKLQAAMP